MNGHERFFNSFSFNSTDQTPLFEDSIREVVLTPMAIAGDEKLDGLENLFTFDFREAIEPNLEPLPVQPDGRRVKLG